MKQAAITINRVAKFISGECRDECIHCGQPVKAIRRGERNVYIRIEDASRCISSVETSLDGIEFWCRQFQGKLADSAE